VKDVPEGLCNFIAKGFPHMSDPSHSPSIGNPHYGSASRVPGWRQLYETAILELGEQKPI